MQEILLKYSRKTIEKYKGKAVRTKYQEKTEKSQMAESLMIVDDLATMRKIISSQGEQINKYIQAR